MARAEQMSFGHWLRRRRKALDLTRAELAERVGCSAATIAKIEADLRRPSKQISQRLAQHLVIPATEQAAFLHFARGGGYQEICSDHSAAPAAPDRSLPLPPSNLPKPASSFIGRERDVAAVCAILRQPDVRLLTLSGPPGVGKTRLAIQVAAALQAEFADGVCFVALAPIHDSALALPTIAQTLGVRESTEQSHVALLAESLRVRRPLLVLDNMEQVVAAAAQLADLLEAVPQLKIVCTSRVRLRIARDLDFPVPPLDTPDLQQLPPLPILATTPAVALFVARAQAIAPGFTLTAENARSVATICRLLDGLPLAIELAAMRIRLLSPTMLLERLTDRLAVLTGGLRDTLARHQTLRAAIEWSYQLLGPAERRLFARLGVLIGSYSFGAIEALAGDILIEPTASGSTGTVLDGVSALVEASLLQRTSTIEQEAYFTMLETIRTYALEQLEASGEAEEIRGRHAAYYLALAKTGDSALIGPTQAVWLTRLDTEYPNLRAALEWSIAVGRIETAACLSAYLWRFWRLRGDLTVGRQWFTRLLAVRHAIPRAILVRVLHGAAVLAREQGDYQQTRALYEEELELQRECGDNCGIAASLNSLGVLAFAQGDAGQARISYEESLAIKRALGDVHGIGITLLNLGNLFWHQTDYEQASNFYTESLICLRGAGDLASACYALHGMGLVALDQGDSTRAIVLLREALAHLWELRSLLSIAGVLEALAHALGAQRRFEQAARLYGSADSLRATLNMPVQLSYQDRYMRERTAVQTQLGASAWAIAWAEGQAMTREEGISYALDITHCSTLAQHEHLHDDRQG